MRTLKLPFREAHHVTGRIVAEAAEQGVALDNCRSRRCRRSSRGSPKRCSRCCRSANSVKSRAAYGGTAPNNVRAQAKRWLKRLNDKKA